MSRLLRLAAPWLCALAPLSALPADPAPRSGVLQIDDEEIAREQYAAWLVRHRGEAYLPLYVKHELVQRAAAERGLTPGDEEIRATIDAEIDLRVERAFGGDRSGWVAELRNVGRSEAGYRARRTAELEFELALQALVTERREVTEEDLREAWETKYGRGGRTLDLRMLRVQVEYPALPPGTDPEVRKQRLEEAREAALLRASQLRDEVRAGADFTELVKQHSSDQRTRSQGGVFPNGFQANTWPAAVLDAVYALEVGEVTSPVLARGAANLFYLVGAEVTDFESIRDELHETLLHRPPSSIEVHELLQELGTDEALEVRNDELFATPSAPEWSSERVVAEVEGRPVTRRQLGDFLIALNGEAMAPRFVEQWLVREAAARRSIDIRPEEVEELLEAEIEDRIERLFRGQRERWLADLEQRGMTEEEFRRERRLVLQADLLTMKVLQVGREVRQDQVRGLWHERYGYEGRSLDVSLILIDPEPLTGPDAQDPEKVRAHLAAEKERINAELERLRERIAAGEDFATLARQFSGHPSRETGGRLEGGFKPNTWPLPVHQAVNDLKPGEVTAPLAFGHGAVVFQLLAAREVPFEEVADELRRELLEQPPSAAEIAGFLSELKAGHNWRVQPAMFR